MDVSSLVLSEIMSNRVDDSYGSFLQNLKRLRQNICYVFTCNYIIYYLCR